MRQKAFILTIIVATILLGCKNQLGSKEQFNPLEELAQIDKLISEIAEKPQQFSAPSDKETIVSGSRGTVIHVDPNRLEAADGSSIGDSIQIELIEMTVHSSLLLNNAQTASNGQILVTGGAYYLNMTSSGNQLKIKQGKGLEVEFPKLTEDEMGLFTGERDSLGQMNWIQTAEKFKSNQNPTSLESEANIRTPKKPLKASENDKRVLTVSFENSVMVPELQHYNNVSFRVNDDCEFNPSDADNFWYNIAISKSKVEGEYIIVFDGVDNNRKEVKNIYEVTPVLEGKDYAKALKLYEAKFNEYLKRKEEIKANIDAEIEKKQEENKLQIETYKAIELSNFGWINCDKFLNDIGPKIDIQILVNDDSFSAARIFAVFKDINSMVSQPYCKNQVGTTTFRNIPVGKKVSIIALSSKNGRPYVFETTIKTRTDKQVQVNFVATTQAEIREKMKELN
jgi:hypothetical protein